MKYTGMMPATDWFFVHKIEGGGTKRTHTVHHLAAWAITDEGKITGLVPVSDTRIQNGLTAKLVTPPPIEGSYVHREQLTPSMLESLNEQVNI